MCSSRGVLLLLDCISAVRRRGLLWIACECCSFTVMCRAVSARSEQINYMGDVSRAFVAEGNLLMTVSSLFYFIGFVSRGVGAAAQFRPPTLHAYPRRSSILKGYDFQNLPWQFWSSKCQAAVTLFNVVGHHRVGVCEASL